MWRPLRDLLPLTVVLLVTGRLALVALADASRPGEGVDARSR